MNTCWIASGDITKCAGPAIATGACIGGICTGALKTSERAYGLVTEGASSPSIARACIRCGATAIDACGSADGDGAVGIAPAGIACAYTRNRTRSSAQLTALTANCSHAVRTLPAISTFVTQDARPVGIATALIRQRARAMHASSLANAFAHGVAANEYVDAAKTGQVPRIVVTAALGINDVIAERRPIKRYDWIGHASLV